MLLFPASLLCFGGDDVYLSFGEDTTEGVSSSSKALVKSRLEFGIWNLENWKSVSFRCVSFRSKTARHRGRIMMMVVRRDGRRWEAPRTWDVNIFFHHLSCDAHHWGAENRRCSSYVVRVSGRVMKNKQKIIIVGLPRERDVKNTMIFKY